MSCRKVFFVILGMLSGCTQGLNNYRGDTYLAYSASGIPINWNELKLIESVNNEDPLKNRVGKLSEIMAADTLSQRQKEDLAKGINDVLGSELKTYLTAESLGQEKDSLAEAIDKKYPDPKPDSKTDKLSLFLRDLANTMRENYPFGKKRV